MVEFEMDEAHSITKMSQKIDKSGLQRFRNSGRGELPRVHGSRAIRQARVAPGDAGPRVHLRSSPGLRTPNRTCQSPLLPGPGRGEVPALSRGVPRSAWTVTRPGSASRPAPGARAGLAQEAARALQSPPGPDTKRPRGSPPHLQHWAPRAFQNHRTPLRRARHSPGLPVPPGAAAAAAAISCRSPSPRSRCQVTPFTWARSRPRLTAPRPDPSRPRLRRLRSALLARSPRSARGDGAQRLGESHRRRAAAPRPLTRSLAGPAAA
ncbi:methyl-CpG-binding domain protein 6-like [Onychomys torridus]|uniref:methyl-CpG-binding domain protein 6-like n=1 Tax=Onychomys torridus TaxID=38674 RepID=UPI00167FDB1B|nr:methyl-CpG-binding domain protein 6-like [Onychomys torridus]